MNYLSYLSSKRIQYDLLILGIGILLNLMIIYCLFYVRLNIWFMGTAWFLVTVASVLFALDVRKEYLIKNQEESKVENIGKINRLSLLNENDVIIRSWNLLGKVSLLIGRDERNNRENNEVHIDVNLSNSKYAAHVSPQHAVLNWSKGGWFIEDISDGNGIEIQKSTGKRIKLFEDTVCQLDYGDVIYIGSVRLKVD